MVVFRVRGADLVLQGLRRLAHDLGLSPGRRPGRPGRRPVGRPVRAARSRPTWEDGMRAR